MVLYGDTFADEGVALDFAILANPGSFLYLNKGTDFGIVAYLAAIEIHKVLDANVFTKFHIRGYVFHWLVFTPRGLLEQRIFGILEGWT
jgi:hypothetical protein